MHARTPLIASMVVLTGLAVWSNAQAQFKATYESSSDLTRLSDFTYQPVEPPELVDLATHYSTAPLFGYDAVCYVTNASSTTTARLFDVSIRDGSDGSVRNDSGGGNGMVSCEGVNGTVDLAPHHTCWVHADNAVTGETNVNLTGTAFHCEFRAIGNVRSSMRVRFAILKGRDYNYVEIEKTSDATPTAK